MFKKILNLISHLFEKWEKTPVSFGSGVFSLIAIVLLRIFFESALEGGQILGLSSVPLHSFYMFFNHFIFFYLSLFLWFLLWIHLITRERLDKIAKVVLFSFFVLFIPPFVDYLISKGRGYHLSSLSGFEEAKLALHVLN